MLLNVVPTKVPTFGDIPMLCMICNTNSNSVKCTQPNKHGFAYVIHYDNNGEALHKHYRFISNDELPINPDEIIDLNVVIPTMEIQQDTISEKNGSFEPNENQTQEKNGSFEPNESIFDESNISSDNVSDNIVQYFTDTGVPIERTQEVPRKRKHKVLANFNVPIAEDNML